MASYRITFPPAVSWCFVVKDFVSGMGLVSYFFSWENTVRVVRIRIGKRSFMLVVGSIWRFNFQT